ncbi:MAG: hypothetical protein IPO92_03700 [Saprospiraceae bacterium]|nr:hypothetical protein [Saprospiraceae bacterium]
MNLFLKTLRKPIAVVFHTVLPLPHEQLKSKVRLISQAVESVIVMTKTSANILSKDYGLHDDKIMIIEHGTIWFGSTCRQGTVKEKIFVVRQEDTVDIWIIRFRQKS